MQHHPFSLVFSHLLSTRLSKGVGSPWTMPTPQQAHTEGLAWRNHQHLGLLRKLPQARGIFTCPEIWGWGGEGLPPPPTWRLNLPPNAVCLLRHLRADVWATRGAKEKGPTVPGAFPSNWIQHIPNQSRCRMLCQAHWAYQGARQSSGKPRCSERVRRNTHSIGQDGTPYAHKRAFISSLFSLKFWNRTKK